MVHIQFTLSGFRAIVYYKTFPLSDVLCVIFILCGLKLIFQVPKSSDDVNLKNPNDMSYVFSGAYTPMLCKLVDQVSDQVSAAKTMTVNSPENEYSAVLLDLNELFVVQNIIVFLK